MKKNIPYLSILLLVLVASCSTGKPLAIVKSDNNATYEVDYLFEHDGCKVYRFNDHGHYVYFTNCEGNTTAIRSDSTKHRTYNTIRTR